MGFSVGRRTGQISFELAHKHECKICPLNKMKHNKHPHMEPSGAKAPDIYFLGDIPGAAEDTENDHFVGPAGKILRAHIPDRIEKKSRFNYCVRTRTPDQNRPATPLEIECCRPSIQRDIAASKPKIIVGLGTAVFNWITGYTNNDDRFEEWRGRRMPISIGGHECWFYPVTHPARLYYKKHDKIKNKASVIGSEDERAFTFDLKRAYQDLRSLPIPEVHDRSVAEYGLELITGKPGDLERLRKLLEWAAKQREAGFDYETRGIRPYGEHAKILTIGIGTNELSFAFPLYHPQAKWTKVERKEVKRLLVEFIRSKVKKWVHHLTFELEWTGFFLGKDLLRGCNWGDTESQAHTLDDRPSRKNRRAGPMSLEFLVLQHFGFNLKSLTKLDKDRLDEEPLEQVLRYNAMDAKYHCLLGIRQEGLIIEEELEHVYLSKVRRVPTCVLTQLKGMPYDTGIRDQLATKYKKQIRVAEDAIQDEPDVARFEKKAGIIFNPGSDDHCIRIFRDFLKRDEGYKDEERSKYSVDEDALKKIDHPLAAKIIQLRKPSKLLSTYMYGDKLIWPDSLLHANFNTNSTTTGRLSSDEPNLQNLPKRDADAREVRRAFVPPAKHVFAAFDYGQIEARVFAMASKDKTFIKALWDRFDIHAHWADVIAHEYPKRIGGKQNLGDWKLGKQSQMKAFRGDIKNQWTFPLFFGATLERVSRELKIPQEVLEPLLRDFQRMFPGVFEWQEEVMEFYRENGYVETLNGFRRRAPMSKNEAINMPIQGTALEIIIDGMNRISELAAKNDDDYLQPAINIHDDLTFILPTKKLDHYAEIIITEMVKKTFKFINVPITVEMSIGTKNFEKMEEVLVASSDDWKVAA